MRVCINCPECNGGWGCADLFGSNAFPEGGIFGRPDGIFISIEAQKSAGGLHAHAQLHVQCIHQHEPFAEVLMVLSIGKQNVVSDFILQEACVPTRV